MSSKIKTMLLFVSLLIAYTGTYCQKTNNNSDFFSDSLFTNTSPLFKNVIQNQEKYKLQIIYTKITKGQNNTVTYQNYTLDTKSEQYYFPASLVKLPVTLIALEKINELAVKGIYPYTKVTYESSYRCQTPLTAYKKSPEGFSSIADFIKRMLVVSDNQSYSRVYEFCGQEYINKKLHQKGYVKSLIIQRFDKNCDAEANRYTNPINFYGPDNKVIYRQRMLYCHEIYKNSVPGNKVGEYCIESGKKIRKPKDFAYSNYVPLQDVHKMMQSVIFPKSVDEKNKFNITENNLSLIKKYMKMLPRESEYEEYKSNYKDAHKKYLFYGKGSEMIKDTSIQIYNVAGMSYGFLSDCMYFSDVKNKVDFFLSAVIYVNKSGIMNSGNYEYQTTGLPFLKELGEIVYKYELGRKKNQQPDFHKLLIDNN